MKNNKLKKKKTNKKTVKLLNNNTFLINASICIVIVLCLCYLGINSPIKKTYSEEQKRCWILSDGNTLCDTGNTLYGDYVWNLYANPEDFGMDTDAIFNEYLWNGKSETFVNTINKMFPNDLVYIKYKSNGQNFNYMHRVFDDDLFSIGYVVSVVEQDILGYDNVVLPSEGVSQAVAWYMDGGKWFKKQISEIFKEAFMNSPYRVLTFETPQTVSDEFYEWFSLMTTPVDKCYYNYDLYMYSWTNSPSFGSLMHQYTTEASCPKAITFTTEYNGGNLYECFEYDSDGNCSEYDFNSSTSFTRSMTKGDIYDLSERDDFELEYYSYTLTGWKTLDNREFALNAKIQVDDNIVLYPKWQKVFNAITYNTNGGILDDNNVEVPVNSSTLLLEPSRTGYTFEGWYSDSKLTNKIGDAGDEYEPFNHMTLYAKWELIDEITISYGDYQSNIYTEDLSGMNYLVLNLGTTISDLEGKITVDNDKYSIKLPSKVVTGQKIQLSSDNGVDDIATIVVLGDVFADGKIGYNDYVLVYNHIYKTKHPTSDKKLLTDEFLLAADYSKDSAIKYNDYVLIYNIIKENKKSQ